MNNDIDVNQNTVVPINNRNLSLLNLSTAYRTGQSDPITDFYKVCLEEATNYDRAVGYFRSSIYLMVGPETVEFAKRGGKIRLVCSPSLFEEDAQSIEVAYEMKKQIISQAFIEEIDQMLASPEGAYRTKVLATLICVGALDIRLALRTTNQGLYHEKIGIFTDGHGNAVSFIGSANETWDAWHECGNFESIEVFCSWSDNNEQTRVRRHQNNFEHLWVDHSPGVRVVPFPEAVKAHLLKTAYTSLSEVNIKLFHKFHHKNNRSLLPHQQDAITGWERQGKRGIFEHATGSGKTFTALMIIKKHIEIGFPALILVPSRLLLEQWANEIKAELPDAVVLLAGAENNKWKGLNRLRSMTVNDTDLGQRIVLSTMKTAASNAFRSKITQGDHLLIVADEVHQIGSSFNSKALEIASGPRLGLSATPSRYGDPVGTQRILNYFGNIVPPVVTLQDAINAGRLVEYEYHPHPIHLTLQEAQMWKKSSSRIKLEMAKSKKDKDKSNIITDKIKIMIIQRARIAKTAANKVPLAIQILKSNYQKGQSWLIYCEDSDQLSEVVNAVAAEGLSAVEYHTSMEGNRQAALDWFKTFGDLLVSIKCLDEGVDIPAVDHALILASSQNPRQFIQRRGRVLRCAPNKALAVIYDVIVVPISIEDEPEQSALLESEFLRAISFANSAINLSAGAELRGIAARLGLDPDSLKDDGIEMEG